MSINWETMKTAEQIEAERLEKLAQQVRAERDKRMMDVTGWYQRYEREVRLGLEVTIDLERIDFYAQALADIPNQTGFPTSIEYPVL